MGKNLISCIHLNLLLLNALTKELGSLFVSPLINVEMRQ